MGHYYGQISRAHVRLKPCYQARPPVFLGRHFLAGSKSALVADIGGTTTDIAFLQNGTPRLKQDGAFVGGWQTMVEAAEIRTCGLGADSESHTPFKRSFRWIETWPAPSDALVLAGGELATN